MSRKNNTFATYIVCEIPFIHEQNTIENEMNFVADVKNVSYYQQPNK